MAVPNRAELNELCKTHLNIPLEDLLVAVPVMRKIQVLLDKPLYIQRFAGLLRSTNKEDPLDCTYVLKCVIELLKHKEEFKELIDLMQQLGERNE